MCFCSRSQTSQFQHTTNTEPRQFLTKGNCTVTTDLQVAKENDEEGKTQLGQKMQEETQENASCEELEKKKLPSHY